MSFKNKEKAFEELDLGELLKERQRINELLRKKYTRRITILFTDIKGSTAYYEVI